MSDSPEHLSKAARIRQQRLDRWRRPLVTPWDRLRAWANMIFVDHGFFRMVYLNLHRISPNAWPAAQPTPYQVRGFARRGIRTVVTLRGGQSYGSLPLEIEACRDVGIAFEKFVLRSRAIPTVEDMLEAKAFFERIEYPVLFHCKSGADRAGMMSALYLILHEGVSVSEARKQLSIRFGHIRQGKTGILDALFDTYLADQPDEEMEFLDWARTRYDPKAITNAFKAGTMGTLLTETLLRRE
jgi:protein tyrosine/serine phosphatase